MTVYTKKKLFLFTVHGYNAMSLLTRQMLFAFFNSKDSFLPTTCAGGPQRMPSTSRRRRAGSWIPWSRRGRRWWLASGGFTGTDLFPWLHSWRKLLKGVNRTLVNDYFVTAFWEVYRLLWKMFQYEWWICKNDENIHFFITFYNMSVSTDTDMDRDTWKSFVRHCWWSNMICPCQHPCVLVRVSVHGTCFLFDVLSHLAFCPIRCFVPFWIFSIWRFFHSMFLTIRRFVPFSFFFHLTFCPIWRFFHLMFCPIRHFVLRRFVVRRFVIWHFVVRRFVVRRFVVRRFVVQRFVVWRFVVRRLSFNVLSFDILTFDVLSLDVLSLDILSFDVLLFDVLLFLRFVVRHFLLSAFATSTFCQWTLSSPAGALQPKGYPAASRAARGQ